VIGVARESWILIGFVALAVAAVVVSAAGWILFVRERRYRRQALPNPGAHHRRGGP
jgi:hypothetical protein